jgi:quinol monooxygenase YgiN
MAFMLKIRWDIKNGKLAEFKSNQEALCKVMLDHPGVICYHVDYPAESYSEWVEIYANDDTFRAHLANEKGKGPLGAVIGACDKIACRCFGVPDAESRKILEGFGTTYHQAAPSSFALNPKADKDSRV